MAKHQPAAERRRQILDAALACFAQQGFHGARMDDIAKRAGLSKGAVYHHFGNKNDVFNALFQDYAEQFALFLSHAREEAPADVAFEYGCVVLRTLTVDRELAPAWIEFFSHPDGREQMATVYQQARTELAEQLIRGGTAHATAALIVGAVEGLLLQAITDGDFDPLDAWQTSAPPMLQALLDS